MMIPSKNFSFASSALLLQLQRVVQTYLGLYPAETPGLIGLQSQLSSDNHVLSRHNMAGHITSSTLVLDSSLKKVLLIHHRASRLWLPPGGHYEGSGSLLDSARRELAEETGLVSASPFPHASSDVLPLDIESHPIAARPSKGESAHCHHDFAYLMFAEEDISLRLQETEVLAAHWMFLEDLIQMTEKTDSRMQRMTNKAMDTISGQRGIKSYLDD